MKTYNDNYDVNMLLNKSNKKKFNNDCVNEIQYKIKNRIIQSRNRDTLYSLKNRRTINKDWKDFNNYQ